jgi:quinol monooxygenase YgiN
MYGRITIVDGKPEQVEAGLTFLRTKVGPAVNALPGCLGMSVLTDRPTGQVMVLTAWRDEESIAGSAEAVAPLRQEASAILGGDARTESWELAAMHQVGADQPGYVTRSVLMSGSTADIEKGLAMFTDTVVPQVTALAGFNTISLLVDRQHGLLRVGTTYVDQASAEAARDAGAAIRAGLATELNLRTQTVQDLEVVSVGIRSAEDPALSIQLPVEQRV